MKLLEHLSHCVDTLLFLLHVGMDIEVERCADVGMAKEHTDGLVVAFAFDAARGEAVAETMEAHFGQPQFFLEFIEVAPICPGFCGFG